MKRIILAWSKRVNKKYLGDLPITLICPENLKLPVSIRINLIRIALGAIANSILHSGVIEDQRVSIGVKIRRNGNRLVLSVSDTGIGAEPLVEGYGINRMRILVQELKELDVDGQLHIRSKSNQGTKVTLVLYFSESALANINNEKVIEYEN